MKSVIILFIFVTVGWINLYCHTRDICFVSRSTQLNRFLEALSWLFGEKKVRKRTGNCG